MSASGQEINPQIAPSWKALLADDFLRPEFTNLKQFLLQEKSVHTIYPPGSQIFSAFNHTDVENVRVVIIGQDPYHGAGQAHGLCFSVPDGIAPPPSLVNIYKELHTDLNIPMPSSGNLENWARQGVLLLNATLTVRAGQAGSHQGKGWEQFTDSVIRKISTKKKNLVFLLWGRFAQQKEALIADNDHLILKAAHPSPFSAYSGFFGCRHFSKANAFLEEHNLPPINWNPVVP